MGGSNKNVALPWGKAYNRQDQLSGKVCQASFLISLWIVTRTFHRLPFAPKDTGGPEESRLLGLLNGQ